MSEIMKPLLIMKAALALLISAFFMGQVPAAEANHRHGQWVQHGNDYYWQRVPPGHQRLLERYDADRDYYYYYNDDDDDDDDDIDLDID